MTPAELAEVLLAAVRRAVESGALEAEVPASVHVERPRQREHGDYATNVALQLAKAAGRPPRDVAEVVKSHIDDPRVASVDIAGPGFLNIRLAEAALGELARTVVTAGADFGHTDLGNKRKVNLEFVSANPTGPIHLGGARWAAVGDSLARLLQATGYDVTREYYFNDHGAQIDRFALSLLARAKGESPPEDGYAGAYVDEIAQTLLAKEPGLLDLPPDEAQEFCRREGVELMFTEIKRSLHDFGVDFDVFAHEAALHESGAVERAVERLRQRGHIDDKDGAVWLRTTDFGDDKDRVVIKSDGQPSYFSGDIAYYLDKRERGFEVEIIFLGADHHGYIARLMAMVAALGDTPYENLQILIGQFVRLVKDGEPVRMSKRAGNVVVMDDLVEAVGVDAARYALARSSVDSMLDIDLDLLTRQASDNPVFYVQYAHARIASLLRHAAEVGATLGTEYDPALLSHEKESDLLRALGEFPRVVSSAAELREPHRVARYLEELAGIYHRFYDACRVLPGAEGEPAAELTRARLWLCEATRTVLANGLGLLGVTAPERM